MGMIKQQDHLYFLLAWMILHQTESKKLWGINCQWRSKLKQPFWRNWNYEDKVREKQMYKNNICHNFHDAFSKVERNKKTTKKNQIITTRNKIWRNAKHIENVREMNRNYIRIHSASNYSTQYNHTTIEVNVQVEKALQLQKIIRYNSPPIAEIY